MKYPEFLVGIVEQIADYFGRLNKTKYYATLSPVEKKIDANITIKSGETEGSATINIDKKMLITDIMVQEGSNMKISITKDGKEVIKDYTETDEIAYPMVFVEGNATIHGSVPTAPTSDTTYTVTIRYLEIELIE